MSYWDQHNCDLILHTRRFTYRSFIFYWLPAISLVAGISYLSHLPAQTLHESTKFSAWMPMVYHTTVFCLLAISVYRVSSLYLPNNGLWPFLIAIILPVVYAVVDEFHQSFVPGRFATIEDVVYDSLGTTIGIIIIFVTKFITSLLSRYQSKHPKQWN